TPGRPSRPRVPPPGRSGSGCSAPSAIRWVSKAQWDSTSPPPLASARCWVLSMSTNLLPDLARLDVISAAAINALSDHEVETPGQPARVLGRAHQQFLAKQAI